MNLNIPLDLTKHCIETEINRLHNRLISKHLKQKKQDDILEAQIQALQKALTQMDFAHLRSTFPELSGNTPQNVVLLMDADSDFHIFINDQEVYKFSA